MKDLTQGSEGKLIIQFALPMLIGNVFQQFYNMVDSWVVGRYVGTAALAAVGTSFPIVFLMVSLAMGVGMGANVLVAQYYGAKDYRHLQAVIDTTYITLLAASVFLTLFGLLAVDSILTLLKVPAEVMEAATVYLRIMFLGLFLTFGYNAVGAILRGLGDSVTPLYILIVATVINIILDLVFVRVFGMGVAGVAWATLIAQGVSFVVSVVYLNKTHEVFKTNFLKLRFNREIFRQGLKIGLPSGIQQSLVSLGMMVLTGVVNGFGTTVMAGFSAAHRIDTFVGMPAMNISAALSSFTGQNIGAGKLDRVRRGYHAALKIGLLITLVFGTILLIFGGNLVGIFTRDEEVIGVGAEYLRVIAPFFFLFTVMFITNGLIRGAGEAMVPMISTLMATWLVRVPCAILFSRIWGVRGIWFSFPAGWTLGLSIALLYYKSGRWTSKSFIKSE